MNKRILLAYWLRWWHCLYFGITKIFSEDHRMQNVWHYEKVAEIGCACGKKFYEKHFMDIYNEVNGTDFKAEIIEK